MGGNHLINQEHEFALWQMHIVWIRVHVLRDIEADLLPAGLIHGAAPVSDDDGKVYCDQHRQEKRCPSQK